MTWGTCRTSADAIEAATGQLLTLTISGRAGQAFALQLLDNAGRLLHTQSLHPSGDEQSFPLALPAALPVGTYHLRTLGDGSAPLHFRLLIMN